MKIQLNFTFERDTPNTRRFKEDQADETQRPVVGTLYLRKDVVGNAEKLSVTIENGAGKRASR